MVVVRCVLLALVLGSIVVATYAFRQEISLAVTLHQLRNVYPERREYTIEMQDDGWSRVDVILPAVGNNASHG